MAKFLCAISGIEVEVSYLPLYLSSREYAHPIFFIPQRKLMGLYSKFQSGALGEIESYLLYLAYFHSTGKVEWRTTASFIPKKTPQIVASNMESLVRVVECMNAIRVPSFQVPSFVCTQGTKDLENSKHWISAWSTSLDEFKRGIMRRVIKDETLRIEEKLQRLLLDPNTHPTRYASHLANWAALAADFPHYIADFWKEIIRKSVNEKAIWEIEKVDLDELIEYLEENLELDSTYAISLMRLLREGKEKQIAYLGMGDLDSWNLDMPFVILESSQSIEDANLIAAIKLAPDHEPKRAEYPTEFEFQRARIRWLAAQRTQIKEKE